MGKRKDYEPIPEAEGEAATPQDRYPEANTEEAVLLGLLDEFMQDSVVTVKLPPATIYDFEGVSAFQDFVWVFLCPSLCFLAIAGVSIIFVGHAASEGNIVGTFEYTVGLVGVSITTFLIQKMHSKQSKRLFSMSTKEVAVKAVEDVAISVASKVDLVKMKLCDVVLAMRPKLVKASQNEKALKLMDPGIAIPDPNNVVSELDGAKGEIEESVRLVEEIIPVTPWIPMWLRSPDYYQSRVISRTLILSLGLHLTCFFGLVSYLNQGRMFVNVTSTPLGNHRLMSKIANALAQIVTFKKTSEESAALSEQILASIASAWPHPLVIVVEVYVVTMVQLAVVYLRTRISSTVNIVNRTRALVAEETNHVLRQRGIIFLCQDILEVRMGRVKRKLLNMISLMFKIDMLMKINIDENSKTSLPSHSPSRRQRIGQFFSSSP